MRRAKSDKAVALLAEFHALRGQIVGKQGAENVEEAIFKRCLQTTA
jgi:hypothetical protein